MLVHDGSSSLTFKSLCSGQKSAIVYKIFKQQQFFLLWKNSKLLLNAIRSKVRRFLSDGTGWWHRFWWKILRSALLSSALTTASLCGSKELLAVCCSGTSCSEEVTGGREEERMKERSLLPSWKIPFSPYSLICAGEASVPRRLQVLQHFSIRFLLSLQPFSRLAYIPSCLFPSVHAQAELDI